MSTGSMGGMSNMFGGMMGGSMTPNGMMGNPMAAMAVYQQVSLTEPAGLSKLICFIPFQEDLVSLGKIVLALSCNSFIAIQRENIQQSMELVTTHYSNDLRNLIMYLLTNSQRAKSVNDLMPMIGESWWLLTNSE